MTNQHSPPPLDGLPSHASHKSIDGHPTGLDVSQPRRGEVSSPSLPTGLDVSQWQAITFPWPAAARAGHTFTYIRASVRGKVDPLYKSHHTAAQAAGLLTGPYHYLYPTPDPTGQVQTFLATITWDIHPERDRDKEQTPHHDTQSQPASQPSPSPSLSLSLSPRHTLPPAVDVEENDLHPDHIEDFCRTFHQLTGAWPAIYTSAHKWHAIAGRDEDRFPWARNCPLWIADWRDVEEPALPAPWDHWFLWQYTSRGRVPGYPGPVDLNRFNGTLTDLQNLTLQNPTTPPREVSILRCERIPRPTSKTPPREASILRCSRSKHPQMRTETRP